MHRVMVLGIGLQGRAVVHDLVHNDGIDTVVAADGDAAQLRRAGPLLGRAVPATVDATDPADLARLFAAHRPHLVVGMLPHALGRAAAEAVEREKEAARQRELAQAQSLAEAERQRAEVQTRASWRLRWLAAGLALVFLLAVGAAG